MGVEWILGGVMALLTVVAGYFKMSRDNERVGRRAAEDRAKRNASTAQAQAKAAIDLQNEVDRQREQRQPPDTDKRTDLEGKW